MKRLDDVTLKELSEKLYYSLSFTAPELQMERISMFLERAYWLRLNTGERK